MSNPKPFKEWYQQEIEQEIDLALQPQGYHLKSITKGRVGELSKVKEEIEELEDALAQGSRIMAMLELSDIYGALELYTKSFGLTMNDLKIMSDITQRAFISGARKSKEDEDPLCPTCTYGAVGLAVCPDCGSRPV